MAEAAPCDPSFFNLPIPTLDFSIFENGVTGCRERLLLAGFPRDSLAVPSTVRKVYTFVRRERSPEPEPVRWSLSVQAPGDR